MIETYYAKDSGNAANALTLACSKKGAQTEPCGRDFV